MLGRELILNSPYLLIYYSEVTQSTSFVDNENELQIKDMNFLELQCLDYNQVLQKQALCSHSQYSSPLPKKLVMSYKG